MQFSSLYSFLDENRIFLRGSAIHMFKKITKVEDIFLSGSNLKPEIYIFYIYVGTTWSLDLRLASSTSASSSFSSFYRQSWPP